MQFPARAFEIVQTLYVANAGLTTGTEDQQRLFVRLVAEQCAYEFGPQWGNKRVPGHPQGPSTIAYTGDPDGFGGWRIIDNDGTVTGTKGAPYPHPPWQLFAGQEFIPADPIDHLGVANMPRPPTPSRPDPPPSSLDGILARLAAMDEQLHLLTDQWPALDRDLQDLKRQLDELSRRPAPTYTGRTIFGTVVLKPG